MSRARQDPTPRGDLETPEELAELVELAHNVARVHSQQLVGSAVQV